MSVGAYDPRKSYAYQIIRARFRAQAKAEGRRCAICGHAIDYDAPPRHPSSFALDHIKPVEKYPELALDVTNMQATHFGCNGRKGDREEGCYSLGVRSPRLTL